MSNIYKYGSYMEYDGILVLEKIWTNSKNTILRMEKWV